MEYPIFQMPLIGGSLLIAIVAIVHVVIAHFAVGAGLFNAVHETLALRRGDHVMLAFLQRHSRFLILFSFIAGTVTGVGIWFTIALVAPRATSNLIHLFVWAWATEWVFFIVEIAAGYVYYATWDRMPAGRHKVVGWIYAGASFASLVLINGIISFMLTPGRFAGPTDFWHNLLNPSFWPSTLIRAISCMALVSIFVMILANYTRGFTRDQRQQIVQAAGRWLMPLGLMAPLAGWYFLVVPDASRQFIFGQSAIVMGLMFAFGVAASLLIAGFAYFGMMRAGRYVTGESALLLLGIATIATGSMEFVREGIRKPFLIRGVLYSTQLTPAELADTEREGTLAHAKWYPPSQFAQADPAQRLIERGRAVFLIQCSACHTAGGAYNPAAPLVRNWTDDLYDSSLKNLHVTKDAMPHYRPSADDKAALTAYLKTLNPPPSAVSAAGVNP